MHDIDKAVKEAAEFEAQDKKRKEAIDARNDADSYRIPDTAGIRSGWRQTLMPADKSAVEADMNAVKAFLDAHQNAEEMTDAQVAELKAATGKTDRECAEGICKDV